MKTKIAIGLAIGVAVLACSWAWDHAQSASHEALPRSMARPQTLPIEEDVVEKPATFRPAEREITTEPARPNNERRRLATPTIDPEVTGVVVDEDGVPVPRVRVTAMTGGDAPELRRTTWSDTRGDFAFAELPEGFWFFSVDDARYAKTWWRENGTNVYGENRAFVTVRLHRPRAVHGLVMNEAGVPVSDVKVTLALEWIEGNEHPVQGHLTPKIQVARTGEDGTFRMERLRPGWMTAVIDHPGYARTVARFEARELESEARLVIERGGILRGWVFDGRQPLAGVIVDVGASSRAALSMGHWRVLTDERGSFTVQHVHSFFDPQNHGAPMPTLRAKLEDPVWSSATYRVYETSPGILPELVIQASSSNIASDVPVDVGNYPPRGSIVVRVRPDAGATNAPHVGMTAFLMGDSEGGEVVIRNGSLPTGTSFSFRHVPAGQFRVWVRGNPPWNYLAQEVGLLEGEAREVVLEAGEADLSGVIIGDPNRTTGGRVSCKAIATHPLGTRNPRVKTYEEGRYEVFGLSPGRYRLTYQSDGEDSVHFEVEIGAGPNVFDMNLPLRE